MTAGFNIREVFEMAIRIEENGASFYRRAAEIQQGEDDSKAFLGLAVMEDDHRRTFCAMRDSLDADFSTEDVAGEGLLYLQAIADAHRGEGDPDRTDLLGGDETLEEILQTALMLEKRSILFYAGLKEAMPPELGKQSVDAIIAEEQRHVVQLSTMLGQTKSA